MNRSVVKAYGEPRVSIDLTRIDAGIVMRALLEYSASIHDTEEDAEGGVSLQLARELSAALESPITWPVKRESAA